MCDAVTKIICKQQRMVLAFCGGGLSRGGAFCHILFRLNSQLQKKRVNSQGERDKRNVATRSIKNVRACVCNVEIRSRVVDRGGGVDATSLSPSLAPSLFSLHTYTYC